MWKILYPVKRKQSAKYLCASVGVDNWEQGKTRVGAKTYCGGVVCNNIIISCPQFWSSLMELRTIYKYRADHLSRRLVLQLHNIFLLCRQSNLRLWDLMCESFSIFPESQVLLVGCAAFNGLRIWCFYEVIL